jgi:hypothetical protein
VGVAACVAAGDFGGLELWQPKKRTDERSISADTVSACSGALGCALQPWLQLVGLSRLTPHETLRRAMSEENYRQRLARGSMLIRRGYSHASSNASNNSARRVLHSIFVSGCLPEVPR